MGMLDLTGVDVPERPELRHLVARSARAIEDAVLLQRPHSLRLRLNWPGSPLGGDNDGLVLLDADGYLLGSNSTARQLIPTPLQPPGMRMHCSDVLALPWAQLFDAAARHHPAPLDLPLWSGLRLHALAQRPSTAAPAPLRATETALIHQAVQDARGNVAQAARALGISRATVYRKLGRH
jgi:transcriptional regulator of acetoin/glycerol metabolism